MPEIIITDAAKVKINQLLGDNETKFLRVSVQGIG